MGSSKVLRLTSPPVARPRTLTADLRETVRAMDARRYFDGACVRCGLESSEHTLMGAVACGRATNHETRR